MATTIANSMTPNCRTRAFYKCLEVDLKDLVIVWSDHFGKPMSGSVEDFGSSREWDAVVETEAGEGW